MNWCRNCWRLVSRRPSGMENDGAIRVRAKRLWVAGALIGLFCLASFGAAGLIYYRGLSGRTGVDQKIAEEESRFGETSAEQDMGTEHDIATLEHPNAEEKKPEVSIVSDNHSPELKAEPKARLKSNSSGTVGGSMAEDVHGSPPTENAERITKPFFFPIGEPGSALAVQHKTAVSGEVRGLRMIKMVLLGRTEELKCDPGDSLAQRPSWSCRRPRRTRPFKSRSH